MGSQHGVYSCDPVLQCNSRQHGFFALHVDVAVQCSPLACSTALYHWQLSCLDTAVITHRMPPLSVAILLILTCNTPGLLALTSCSGTPSPQLLPCSQSIQHTSQSSSIIWLHPRHKGSDALGTAFLFVLGEEAGDLFLTSPNMEV